MVGLWLKLQMETVDYNDSIVTCLPPLYIFISILRTVMHQSAEAHPGLSQEFKINLSSRIVDAFRLTLLTNFVKRAIMDV